MGYEEDIYFNRLNRQTISDPPTWAVSDEKILEWMSNHLVDGIVKDYLDYVRSCGPTPLVYHMATVLSTLSYTLANCDIIIKRFKKDDTGKIIEDDNKAAEGHIVPVLWSAIVGESGDRKSTAMDFGRRILLDAIKDTDFVHGEAPDFASPEALTEHMAEHGPVFTFRDELSTLFSPSRRAHLEHMKSTLLLIYEHQSIKRRRVKEAKWKRGQEEDDTPKEAYQVEVEKPIQMILGCIPPKVFAKQTSVEDWDTGLLPRFLYWPGYLDLTKLEPSAPNHDVDRERELSDQIRKVCLLRKGSGLRIVISHMLSYDVAVWIHKRIDPLRGYVSGAYFSYLKRSYATVIRIAAVLAVAELGVKPKARRTQAINVTEVHVDAAMDLLDLVNPKLMALFNHTKLDRLGIREDSIYQLIARTPTGLSALELAGQLDDAPNQQTINKDLTALQQSGRIQAKLRKNLVGRDSFVYFLPQHEREAKLAVMEHNSVVGKKIKKRQAARNAKNQRAYRERLKLKNQKAK